MPTPTTPKPTVQVPRYAAIGVRHGEWVVRDMDTMTDVQIFGRKVDAEKRRDELNLDGGGAA